MIAPRPGSFRRVAAAIVLCGGAAPHASATAQRAPATLEVTVVDSASRPVAGAIVVAHSSLGAHTPSGQISVERRRSALTGADGRVKLASMPRPPWDVSVSARGYARTGRSRVSAPALTIRLQAGGYLTGVVLDGTSKAPVPFARLSVDDGLPAPSDWEERAARNEAIADAKGVFRLAGVGRGATTLVARAPGYGAARRDGVRPGSRVELFLFPGPTLSGTVRDEAGRPVKNAAVRLQGDGWSSPAPPQTTDGNGAFVIAGVEPGEYLVVAREGARAPAIDTVVVPARGEASLELTLGAGGFVSGRVVDGEGRPLAGARVRVAAFEERGLPAYLGDSLASVSAADGSFALGPLPAGRLGLLASLPRYAPRRLDAELAPRQSVDLRDVVLEPGLAIRGRVRDRDGNGIGGALVSAQQGGAGSGLGTEASVGEAESEADGSFVLAGLKPGPHQVSASSAGLASARRAAEAGGERIELVLEPAGSIVGRIVDARGEPIDGAAVHAESSTQPAPSPNRRWLFASSGGGEGDGRFTLRDAAPDTYGLTIRATGFGEGSLANVKVVAGRATDVGAITLGSGGRVVGTVVDADGQALPGATILVERDVNVHTGNLTAQTDSNGAFEVRGVPPGRVDVIARHPAYVPGRARGVDVDPEQEPALVRIALMRGGRVEGRARHRDGSPFAGGRVQVYPERGGIPGGLDYAATGADGSFVLEHVPAGPVTVNLMTFVTSHPAVGGSPGLTILAGVATRPAEVHEGETTTVDVTTREVVVAGRVTRGSQGAAGVRINVTTNDTGGVMAFMGPDAPRAVAPPSGPPPLTATTREDGGYELLVFGPGHAWVALTAESPRQAYPGREVEIPDAERYELDLELGEVTVSGVVVDRETGGPIAEATVGLRQPGPDGKFKGGGGVSTDGRFAIGADAGDYLLEARAPGHRLSSMPVSVGAGGLSDVRVEMDRGLEIAGRVLDGAGRPVSGIGAYASDPELGRAVSGLYANTQADGSFRIGGLDAKPYVVASGSELNGFAIRTGVVPGEEPLTLTLRPGGRIVLRVVGPDGRPAKDLYPHVRTWDGLRVDLPGVRTSPTEAAGEYELTVPAGTIGLQVGWDKAYGAATVVVRAGEATRAEMTLLELPPR